MEPSTLLLLVAALACPIGMGVMMYMMNRQHTGGQPGQPMPGHDSAADRVKALREQRRHLEQEIAEAEKIAALEAQKETLAHAHGSSAESSDGGKPQPVETKK